RLRRPDGRSEHARLHQTAHLGHRRQRHAGGRGGDLAETAARARGRRDGAFGRPVARRRAVLYHAGASAAAEREVCRLRPRDQRHGRRDPAAGRRRDQESNREAVTGPTCTSPRSSGYRSTSSGGYVPSTGRFVRCLSITALTTAFEAKWLFRNRYAFLTICAVAVAVSAIGFSSVIEYR